MPAVAAFGLCEVPVMSVSISRLVSYEPGSQTDRSTALYGCRGWDPALSAMEIDPVHPASQSSGDQTLAAVARVMDAATSSEGLLETAVNYHRESGGVAWRVRLALERSAAFSIPHENAVRLAAACELAHQASIVHDDVQDRSSLRRSRASALDRFGAPVAICLGDHLLVAAFAIIADMPRCGPLVRFFAACIGQAVAGQADEFSPDLWQCMDLSRYRAMVEGKAGAMVALPIGGALVLAGSPKGEVEAVGRAAKALGAAYQASDDVEDIASDLARGTLNGLVVAALQSQAPPERHALLRLLERGRQHGLPPAEAVVQAQRLRPSLPALVGWANGVLAEATASHHAVAPVLSQAAALLADKLNRALAVSHAA